LKEGNEQPFRGISCVSILTSSGKKKRDGIEKEGKKIVKGGEKRKRRSGG